MTQLEAHIRFERLEPPKCDDCDDLPASIEVWIDIVDMGQSNEVRRLCRICALMLTHALDGVNFTHLPGGLNGVTHKKKAKKKRKKIKAPKNARSLL